MPRNPLCAVDDLGNVSPSMIAFQHPTKDNNPAEPSGSFLFPWVKDIDQVKAAEEIDRLFYKNTRHAQKAGRAAKGDPLNKLILQVVRRTRDVSTKELLDVLHTYWHNGDEAISKIDDQYIHVRIANGKDKKVPISGLKDRLSRAKKIIRGS